MICHFSNEFVREKLDLVNLSFENSIRRIIRLPKIVHGSFAPWITNIAKEMGQRDDVELHIISYHGHMKHRIQEFENNGVFYHMYRRELPFPINYIERIIYPKQYLNFPRNRRIVSGLLKKIKPDIVNLVGAENPAYSLCGLDVQNAPLFLFCQTIYSNPDRFKRQEGRVDQHRWDVEQKLFQKIDYYACTGQMYYDLIKQYKKDAVIFPLSWPGASRTAVGEVAKKYDFAYWGGLLPEKGIENAIEAMTIVKKEKEDVSLLVVGSATEEYQKKLQKRIEELGLAPNICFVPYFAKKSEMLQCVKQGRYALLPIKLDIVSGTIMDAFSLQMPVVTFKTSGTPSLNSNKKTVLISDIDDNLGLANNMKQILSSEDLANELRCNANDYMLDYIRRSQESVSNIIVQYNAIINCFHNGTPIPEELLFHKTTF